MRPILPLLPCLALLLTPLEGVRAEVVLDGTVGSRGRLTLNGRDVRITPDMGSTRGSNLFHSFEKFGVPKDDAVTFEGPAGTANIIGRVTGPDSSQIHGTLRSTAVGAGLWLLNPNGIVVGKGAAIDVPGSLHLSTADELRFEDGEKFSARDIQGSQLTAAAPEAFGFLGGPIGELKVENPQLSERGLLGNVSLTGGTVTIDGTIINSDGGLLLIAAQETAGEIPLFAEEATARDGDITLKGGPFLTVYQVFPSDALRIEGGDVVLDAVNLRAFSFSSFGFTESPAIRIAGKNVKIEGTEDLSFGQIFTRAIGSDRGPSILVTGDDIYIRTGFLYSLAVDAGPSGDIVLDGKRITVTDSSLIGTPSVSTALPGQGGRTVINASEWFALTDRSQVVSDTSSAADAGDIQIKTRDLVVSSSDIRTSSEAGTGRAGNVDIDVQDQFNLAANSVIAAFTLTEAAGGNILISAGSLNATDGARITTSTETSGAAGSIIIQAGDMLVGEQVRIDSEAYRTGDSGSIRLVANRELRIDNGIVSTGAVSGSGGSISIVAPNRLIIENGGGILTNIEGGTPGEQAGSITIAAPRGVVVLDANSAILANAPNVGDGGTIRIATDGLIARPGQIDASARQGNAGTVATTSPQTDIVSSFAGLGAQVAPADRLLATSCDAREIASSLVVGAVRGGEDAFDPRRPLGSQAQAEGCAR